MHIGKALRLQCSILGINGPQYGRRVSLMIPEGADVEVVSETHCETGLVDVRWESTTASVFAEDLFRRSIEVGPSGASVTPARAKAASCLG